MRGSSLVLSLGILLSVVCQSEAQQNAQAGVVTASAMQSSAGANDGVARALAACPASGECTVEVDTGYRGVENLPVPKTDFSVLIDRRRGIDGRTIHNPATGRFSTNYVDVWADKDAGATDTKAGGWGGYKIGGQTIHVQVTSPGWTLGTVRTGAGGWSTANVLDVQGDYFGYGIDQGLVINTQSRGIGDKAGEYIYSYCYGGLRAGSDEACEGLAMNMGEGDAQYAGTVTGPAGAGPGAMKIKTVADAGKGQDPGNQGDGREWVEDAPMASVVVTAMTRMGVDLPTTVKLDPGHPLAAELVSNAWGTLSDSVAVPQVVEAGGTTSATFDVALLGGGFTARAGDTLCFGGSFHEQAKVTSATGPHGTHLTALLRHSHYKGTWVMQGGAACSMIDFDANHVAREGKANLFFDYPFDVIGATDATTLMVTQFDRGSAALDVQRGNVMLGSTDVNRWGGKVTNEHGKITIPVDDNTLAHTPALQKQAVVTISGAKTASFNGQCRAFQYVTPGVATCMGDPAHDGDTDNSVLHVAVGTTPFGNGTATLHRAAEIVDVRNTDLANSDPQHIVDGTLTLEANHLLNAVGSTGHIPHDYAEGVHPLQVGVDVYNPYAYKTSTGGFSLEMRGRGVRGFAGPNPNNMSAYSVYNLAPHDTYAGMGGTAYPPNVVSAQGVFQNMFVSFFAPYPTGSVGISYGCPPTSPYNCDDQTFSYSPELYKGFKGELRDNWTPYTDEYRRSVSGSGLASTYRQTPAGFGFDAPVTATAVATPMYTPASSTSDCPKDHAGTQVVGAIWGDGNYLYQCTAPNKIKRTAQLTTF